MREEIKDKLLARKDNVVWFFAGDNMILHDISNDFYYFVLDAGQYIWRLLDGITNFQTLINEVCQKFLDSDQEKVERDCAEFLSELWVNGLIEEIKK